MDDLERLLLGKTYGVDLGWTDDVAHLPCGACLRCIYEKSPVAAVFRLSPLAANNEPLRDGDIGLFCLHNCPCFLRCPLIDKYLRVESIIDLEALAKGLVGKFKACNRDGHLADIGNLDLTTPSGDAIPINLRVAVIKLDGDLHFIIPPMAKIVSQGDNGGSTSRDGRDGDDNVTGGVKHLFPGAEEIQNSFHASNSTTNRADGARG